MSMPSDDLIASQTPVPFPVPVIRRERISELTKFFAWLTGLALSIGIVVALISATSERDDLRSQVREQGTTLECRSAANIVVNRASSDQQIAIARHATLLGQFTITIVVVPVDDPLRETRLRSIATEIATANDGLKAAGDALEAAVTAQEAALKACG